MKLKIIMPFYFPVSKEVGNLPLKKRASSEVSDAKEGSENDHKSAQTKEGSQLSGSSARNTRSSTRLSTKHGRYE